MTDLKNMSVLIVDDLENMCRLVKGMIKSLGYGKKTYIAPNGLLFNRMGAGWHHIDPQEEFSSGITFDDIGVTGASFDIKGYDLGDIPKKTVHDVLMQRIRYGSI